MKHKKQNRGASILLSLLIMAALLAIAVGASRLTIGEIKLVRDIPKSLIAYYAAEAGIEWAIYQERQGGGASDIVDCSVELDNESSYGVEINRAGGTVAIRSVGCYQEVRRAIEVSF